MRGKSTLVSSVLCALLIVCSALSAYAGASYTVQTTPLDVVKNGLTEVMGEVRFVTNPSPAPTPINTNDTITILYTGTTVTNNAGTGITIASYNDAGTGPGSFPTWTTSVNNATTGGQVILTFTAAGTPVAGDYLTINGVRGSVVGKSIGTVLATQFSASPVGSSSFATTTSPTVAIVIDNFVMVPVASDGTIGVSAPQCQARAGLPLNFKIVERDRDVFVQYTSPGPVSPRPLFGATQSSQIHFVITGLESGAKVYWPTPVVAAQTTGSSLVLLSSSSSGDDAVYQFTTPNQGASDSVSESFQFNFAIDDTHSAAPGAGQIVLPATAGLGSSTLQSQMYPGATSTSIIRFADPLTDARPFLSVVKCVTNILFPWVGTDPGNGYETGVAIANTSFDEGAITPPTLPQEGVINIYFWPQTLGAADATVPTPITTRSIKGGDTFSFTFGGLINAFRFGYAIAVCNFQFGHGFAFITQADATGLRIAQGYTGLIIPDPSVTTAHVRQAGPDGSGESLGQ